MLDAAMIFYMLLPILLLGLAIWFGVFVFKKIWGVSKPLVNAATSYMQESASAPKTCPANGGGVPCILCTFNFMRRLKYTRKGNKMAIYKEAEFNGKKRWFWYTEGEVLDKREGVAYTTDRYVGVGGVEIVHSQYETSTFWLKRSEDGLEEEIYVPGAVAVRPGNKIIVFGMNSEINAKKAKVNTLQIFNFNTGKLYESTPSKVIFFSGVYHFSVFLAILYVPAIMFITGSLLRWNHWEWIVIPALLSPVLVGFFKYNYNKRMLKFTYNNLAEMVNSVLKSKMSRPGWRCCSQTIFSHARDSDAALDDSVMLEADFVSLVLG